MSIRCALIVMALAPLILVTGCGQAEPALGTTPVPLAATGVPSTMTRLPPTATPMPAPIDTAIVPTQVLSTDTPIPATPSPALPTATAAPSLAVTATPLPLRSASLDDTWVRPADGMVMVYVPGGTFPMGSAEDDPEAVPDELPQHMVTLGSFWIDQTEVTNAQYEQFLNEHGNRGVQGAKMIVLDQGYTQISQVGDEFVTTKAALDRPVVMVTWHGAATYCEWAGGRLPMEAEWEYAARGPEGNLYPWGNAPPTCDLANHGTCIGVPVDVGSRRAGASWCGALDMAGNVWEWVTDWFGPYSGLPQENPTGPALSDVPVLRGGGWHSPRREIRAAYRQHEVPTTGFNG